MYLCDQGNIGWRMELFGFTEKYKMRDEEKVFQ